MQFYKEPYREERRFCKEPLGTWTIYFKIVRIVASQEGS